MTRIFKARYFLNTSFLKANLGSNPSFVWHNILSSQNLIRLGGRWRIENGFNVRIWSDPWLFNELNPYVKSPMCSGLENAYVDSLRKSDSNLWKEDILKDLFNERDKRLIMQIPLSNSSELDRWLWLWEKKVCIL